MTSDIVGAYKKIDNDRRRLSPEQAARRRWWRCSLHARHGAVEFGKFLRKLDAEVPA